MNRFRLLGLLGAMLAANLVLAPQTLAAEPTFGKARATSTFGESIAVEQPATLPGGVSRVEAVVRAGPDAPTFLSEIPAPGSGATTLRFSYPTPSGGLFPNTKVELGFRVTFDDGRIVDSPTTTIRYDDDRFTWQTLEGDVVRVHWYDGNEAFGRRALEIGEKAVADAAALLGVTESDPIDFYIYAETAPFRDVIGRGLQENVGGLALPPIRTLFANIGPSSVADPWVAIVVPHELTHIVFDTATANPYHGPPHWLNEGLAVYLSQGNDGQAKANVDRSGRSGDLMPLRALELQFPSTADRFSLAYDEAVSAIDFMVRTYGRDALVALIRSYAAGVGDDAAFTAALGVDTAAFQAGWLADLGFEEPVPFGPLPAPAGSLPPGWAPGVAPTQGPGIGSPAPTVRPAFPGGDGGPVGPVIVGVAILLLVILIAGLAITARRLNRGESFLPSTSPNDATPPDDAGSTDEPNSDTMTQ